MPYMGLDVDALSGAYWKPTQNKEAVGTWIDCYKKKAADAGMATVQQAHLDHNFRQAVYARVCEGTPLNVPAGLDRGLAGDVMADVASDYGVPVAAGRFQRPGSVPALIV